MYEGEFFKGGIVDICAELKKESERCGKMKVGVWLKLRKIEKAEAEQFGVSVDVFRKNLKKC